MQDSAPRPSELTEPRWRPLSAMDRRVIGVLVEKAKTTPEQYPLSVSALKTGCNQKNNRYPLMEIEVEDVEESLTRLRAVGAIVEVQGGSRVLRYRHSMYEWLGVDKVELAIMTELLLRGAQTEGELRGRAARMDPIADVAALRPLLDSLKRKGLILSLTPEGRGHVLTHALYEDRELDKLRAQHPATAGSSAPITRPTPQPAGQAHATRSGEHMSAAAAAPAHRHEADDADDEDDDNSAGGDSHDRATSQQSRASAPGASSLPSAASVSSDELAELREELFSLRSEVTKLRKDLDDLWASIR